jgi:glycosyltransferase involved in cell wall biosynthesis
MAVYAGTLGLKHEPEHLVVAAERLAGVGRLLVVTEGLGREHLERRKEELSLDALDLMDYVDYDDLPDVLAGADVCVVLLEQEAGTFSVPSKVLTYLAAGRAVLGAMPSVNLAARIIASAGAGVTVAPGNLGEFAEALATMLAEPGRVGAMGEAGRRYAEEAFDIEAITDRVLAIIAGTTG